MKQILILNGSPSGKNGNCATFIKSILNFKSKIKFKVIHLAERKYSSKLKKEILDSSALIFISGTYWDSWGSPLQAFLEDMTELEGTSAILGKPASVIILMHSVGGKSVLSRLQGVLSSQGFLIPPMSGMVYSLVNQEIFQNKKISHQHDLWGLEDLSCILFNLKEAIKINKKWQSWKVDRKNPKRTWIST